MQITQADIRRQVAQLQREDQQAQLKELGARGLAWLALAPAWTVDLARACDFPAGPLGLEGFLEEAEARGLCERGDIEYKGEFWIRRGERQSTLDMLQDRYGIDFLWKEASQAGQRIRKAADLPVSAPVRRWATLAGQMAESPWHAADWLDRKLLALLDEGRTGEAMGWLDTAAPLAALFGGRLELAVRLGNRRLELAYRRRQDERHIQDFLRRDEQVAALEDLLALKEGAWALHYLGVGGVGKTMLLRYVTAHLAPERKLPTGRIDFDYVSPDYPARRPGQILVELVAELLAYGLDQSQLAAFNNSVDSLHEVLSREPGVGDPLARLDEHQEPYETMIRDFCRLIRGLARPGRPVVLILDTCEELAKFQPPGSRLPSVEATFQILEDVHRESLKQSGPDELPFRVVFAGRRPLAQSGLHWALKPHQAGGKRHLLPERKDYLALHELRGFDHRETKEFLCDIKQVQIPTRDVYRAILRHSLETGRSADVEHNAFEHRPRQFRYNPFDLALYAEWLKSDQALSAEQIAGGAHDPYIEYRILERLRQRDLEDLLPALVLLARFDELVLTPLIEQRPGVDVGAISRELGDQEWIDYRHDEALDATFLQIDNNLLPRLRRYYGCDQVQAPKPERCRKLDEAKRKLAPILKGLLEDEDRALVNVAPDYIDAALRVLPHETGARLWDQIERRIPAEADWSWARRVTGRILGEADHPLWAAVQATLASAQIHLEPDFDVRSIWQTVADTARNHPLAGVRERLEARAFLGQLAARPWSEPPISEADLDRLFDLAPASPTVTRQQMAAAYPELARALESLPPSTRGASPIASAYEAMDHLLRQMAEQPASEPSISEQAASLQADLAQAASDFHIQQQVAAACAALASVLDACEYHNAAFPDPARLQSWALDLDRLDYPRELVAFAHTLAGRAWLSNASTSAGSGPGVALLRRAARMAGSGLDGLDPNRWLDWLPPRDLRSRLRLEAVRALPAELEDEAWRDLSTWRANALSWGDAGTVDWERLVAASLTQELAHRPVARQELDEVRKQLDYDADRRPTCLAHERTPPLVLALARGYLALGLAAPALEVLNEHRSAATASGQDDRTVQATRRGIVDVVRRMRLRSELSLLDELVNSDESEVVVYAWPAALLTGFRRGAELPQPEGARMTPRAMRAWNQCQSSAEALAPLGDTDALVDALNEMNARPYDEACLGLDWFEFAGQSPSTFDPLAWWNNYPRQVEEALRLALRFEALARGDSALPQELVRQIPSRCRAEIALEEGELRALRAPAAGLQMLDHAWSWAQEAQDPALGLMITTAQALARVRRGDRAAAVREHLDTRAGPVYDDFARRLDKLWPAWESLPERTNLSAEQNATLLDDADWREWAVRLLVCVDEAHAQVDPERRARLVEGFAGRIPAEMAGLDRVRPLPWWRRLLDWLREWGPGLVVIAIAVGALYGLYLGFNWLLDTLGLPATVNTWQRIALYAAAWVLLILAVARGPRLWRALTRPLRSWLAVRSTADLFVDQISPEEVSIELDLTMRRLGWRPPFVESVATEARGEMPLPERDADYGRAAVDLDDGLTTPLADLRQSLGRRSLAVALRIRRGRLHAPAWEGMLGYRLAAEGESPLAVLETLRVRREVLSTAPPSPWSDPGWQMGLVQVVRSRQAAFDVEQGWRRANLKSVGSSSLPGSQDFEKAFAGLLDGGGGRDPAEVRTAALLREILVSRFDAQELKTLCREVDIDPGRFPDEPVAMASELGLWLQKQGRTAELLASVQQARPELAVPFKALHLVGTPVQTRAELQWQIAGAQEREAAYEKRTSQADPGRAGELMRADQVPVRLGPLILLQVEPIQEARRRSPADREQAGQARRFAHKLVTAGAPAVLTLPAAFSSAVPAMVGAVAEALGSDATPPDGDRLLAAAEAARRAILTWESDPPVLEPEDRQELALDVCLFLRSEQVLEEKTLD